MFKTTFYLANFFIKSIFSTTFFDFKDSSDISSAVSSKFWLYWVVTIPVTLVVVGIWLWWDKKRRESYDKEDGDLEEDLRDLENAILATMRKSTKVPAWQERVERKENLAKDENNDYGAFKWPEPKNTESGG